MACRYIALVDNSRRIASDAGAHIDDALYRMGMRSCFASGPLRVFVAEGTPTLRLHDNGVVIGHLFTAGGRLIMHGDELPALLNPLHIRKHLLEHCWGEYIVIQRSADDASSLTVTRDPSGGVGCVYSLIDSAPGFITSDISLATCLNLYRKRIDWEFIAYFLTSSNHKLQRTGLMNIRELLPGCSLQMQGKRVDTTLDWCPWDFVAPRNRYGDPREAAHHVKRVVSSTITAWAETDNSILLELSGGLDSSIVAACLGETDTRRVCCTLVTPVPGGDERQYAGSVASGLGSPLHSEQLRFDNARFDAEPPSYLVFPSITALQHATNSVLESAGTAHGVTSFYSGGGGDTVFCSLGSASPAADAIKERGLIAGVTAIKELSDMHGCTHWKAARLTLKKLWRSSKTPIKADRSFLKAQQTDRVLEEHPWLTATPADAFPGDRERIVDLAGTQVFRDYLPRGAQRWIRMPLLSQPVVETCLRVPTWMWISNGLNRAIARTAFDGMLPREILQRRSKGTFVNYSGGVYRRNKDQMRDFLFDGVLQSRGLLDTNALDDFIKTEPRSGDPSLQRVFELCMVENWVRHQS